MGASKKNPSPASPAPEQREKWGNKLQFILSCVGYLVGLGNIWRFSYLAYENGGGAFLVPSVICVFLAGLPLYVLELSLGQFSSLGPISVFRRMTPVFQGVGWALVTVSFNISLYYNVIIAWILNYFFVSFQTDLPWARCNPEWATYLCVSLEDQKSCGVNETFFNKTCFNNTQLNDSCYDGQFLGYLHQDTVNVSGTLHNTINHIKQKSLDPNEVEKFKSSADEFFNYVVLASFICLWGGVQKRGSIPMTTRMVLFITIMLLVFPQTNGLEFRDWTDQQLNAITGIGGVLIGGSISLCTVFPLLGLCLLGLSTGGLLIALFKGPWSAHEETANDQPADDQPADDHPADDQPDDGDDEQPIPQIPAVEVYVIQHPAPIQHQAPIQQPAPIQHQTPVQHPAPIQHQAPVQHPAPNPNPPPGSAGSSVGQIVHTTNKGKFLPSTSEQK